MIEMSIIEYFAGDYSGNIIYPLPNSVKTSIMLARCNHCVSKTVNFGDRPALLFGPLLGQKITKTIVIERYCQAMDSALNSQPQLVVFAFL